MNTFDEMKHWLNEPSVEVAAEKLVLEAVELILEQMERANVSHTELAKLLGKSNSHVSQLLSGDRTMTLRTLAKISFALSCQVKLNLQPLEAD